MKVWTDLTHTADEKNMLQTILGGNGLPNSGMGGMYPNLFSTVQLPCGFVAGAIPGDISYIPLQFWFCKNPGLALPLIALQYHEVKFNIKLSCELIPVTGAVVGAEVWCDYIFLDTDERRRFAQVSHEYLIEQVQSNVGAPIMDNNLQHELRFNHPVKELIWTAVSGNEPSLPTSGSGPEPWIKEVSLQLNGHDRFRKRRARYFSQVQRYEHHTGSSLGSILAGTGGVPGAAPTLSTFAGTIYMYSFTLKPEEHQPSGTCNFSRIDNAVLGLRFLYHPVQLPMFPSHKLNVWAVNYNVLRIMSGMGGLAYSN